MIENTEIKPKLMQLLQQTRKVLPNLSLDEADHLLQTVEQRLLDKEVRVLVVGELSRGKSTLLNALAEQELLMMSAIPCPTVNILRWADKLTIEVTRGQETQTITLADLQAANENTDEPFSQVEIALPLDLWAEQVEIIEFPALSQPLGADDADHQQLRQFVAQADLVVVVLASDSLLSNTENEMIKQYILTAGHQDLIFVCNFFDRIQETERADIRRHARVRLPVNEEAIFFVSALEALEGHRAGNEAIVAQSGVLELCTSLKASLTQNRMQLKSERARRVLKRVIGQAREQAEQRMTIQAQTQEALKQEVSQWDQKLRLLRQTQRRIGDDLENFRRQMREVMETKTSSFIKGMASQLEQWAAEYRGEELPDYLNQKIKSEFRTWQQNEVVYLKERVASQQQVLQGTIERFIGQLEEIYIGIGADASRVRHIVLTPDNELHLPINNFSLEARGANGKQRPSFNLLEAPEILIVAAGAIVVGMFWQPWLVIPAGVGLAAWLGYSRYLGNIKQVHRSEVQVYVTDIRSRSDQITLQVADAVDQQVANMQELVNSALNQEVAQAENMVKEYLDRQAAQTAEPQDWGKHLNQIEQIELELKS